MNDLGSLVQPPGKLQARAAVARLLRGKGRYTDDLDDRGAAHVVFLRSPHAHARIDAIDVSAARTLPGVMAIFSGRDLESVCRPMVTRLGKLPNHFSAPQAPIAIDEVCYKGEAVLAIVAESRSIGEDAAELVSVTYTPLPHVGSIEEASLVHAPPVHSSLAGNVTLDEVVRVGDIDAAFHGADLVVSHRFLFSRQTGVSLEPRVVVARFDRLTEELTVHQSHQAPFQMKEVYAAQLDLPSDRVHVICPDVGGAFGLKLHAYADELAAVAISLLIDRPVKFVADRIESFESDAHAREAIVQAKLAISRSGEIRGLDVDVLAGFGAYSCYPRGSVGEALQAMQVCGAPYRLGAFRGRVRGVYQNKVPTGAYRGVGQPIACAVTEQLIDLAATRIGMDPAAFRAMNFRSVGERPLQTEGGLVLEDLSLDQCLTTLLNEMGYESLRSEQRHLREHGIWRGIGLCAFVEITGAGSSLYGPQGLRISGLEGARVKLEASGRVRLYTSVTDQGQGTHGGLAQIVAEELGVTLDSIDVIAGDTELTPYGGGAFASRGIALGGEAALRATRVLRHNILEIAASILQASPDDLKIENGKVLNSRHIPQISLKQLAEQVHFRTHDIPLEVLPQLEITSQYMPELPHLTSNGVIAAHVEVDQHLGTVRLLHLWAADDCGRIINPQLVDEQLRGGLVQAVGAALYEECIYSKEGQLANGSLADYMLPLASEMPDISVVHVSTPTRQSILGARGVGEAGVVGGIGAIWTAVNDALQPSGRMIGAQPFTPERILDALQTVSSEMSL